MNADKRAISTTTGGEVVPGYEDAPAPAPINPATGQHGAYWVLDEDERAKGFVRPVRRSYCHVGPPGPRYPLQDLTAEEREQHAAVGYTKFEPYPESESPVCGRYWTQAQLDRAGKGCRAFTTMGQAIAETYAREPRYYGSTFCTTCREHLPVEEFCWAEPEPHARGFRVTEERVGS